MIQTGGLSPTAGAAYRTLDKTIGALRHAGLDPARVVLDDPETNIRLGIKYLDVLRQEFGDDRVAILAAYNAGPKKAREWRNGGPLALDAITFPETKMFVQRVLAAERWIRRLQRVKGFFHV